MILISKKKSVISLEMSEEEALALARVIDNMEKIIGGLEKIKPTFINPIEKNILESLPEALLSLIAEV